MAISVNKHIIIGRVGADPDVRGQNSDIVALNVATSEHWKDSQGQRQERTTWHKVVIFAPPSVNFAKQYIKKGDMVYVEGTVETRKWEKDGQDVYITETVIRPYSGNIQLHSKEGGADRSDSNRDSGRDSGRSFDRDNSERDDNRIGGNFSRDLDDEIPF